MLALLCFVAVALLRLPLLLTLAVLAPLEHPPARPAQRMTGTLLALAGIFAELSLLAFGGGNSILPEMQRQVVEVHPWMSAADFTALYGLAQAAPGPNLMVVTLVGWRVAGLPGAVVTTVATFAPSSLLTIVGVTVWHRFRQAPWRRAVQAGLVPITAGLVDLGRAADRAGGGYGLGGNRDHAGGGRARLQDEAAPAPLARRRRRARDGAAAMSRAPLT